VEPAMPDAQPIKAISEWFQAGNGMTSHLGTDYLEKTEAETYPHNEKTENPAKISNHIPINSRSNSGNPTGCQDKILENNISKIGEKPE